MDSDTLDNSIWHGKFYLLTDNSVEKYGLRNMNYSWESTPKVKIIVSGYFLGFNLEYFGKGLLEKYVFISKYFCE